MNAPEALAGTEIAGYALVREIGRGAVGVVFEATAPDGERAAVKIVVPPGLLQPDEKEALRARFFREARAMAAVHHPNIARILDVGEDEGRLFMAMELLEGENLRQILTRAGTLSPEETVALGLQLCAALEAVHHAGIVHRDVKPENLVVSTDGVAKLTDFGVAWMENETTLTRTGGVLGSPAYMAPEQILGRSTDRRSDLFSAAATLYQLVTGVLPFTGGSLMEMAHNVAYGEPKPLPADVPYALGRAILRGLQKSPGARYAAAGEFADALRQSAAPRGRAKAWAAAPPAPDLAATVVTSNAAFTPIIADPGARCARHPGRPSVGRCRACSRALCRHCARSETPPFYCPLHVPITIFGISTVRLEIAVALVAFILLLLVFTPIGQAVLRH